MPRRLARPTSDNYDNALAETVNGLFKTELIRREGPWRTIENVERATLRWVDWGNPASSPRRLQRHPPAEFEALHYRQQVSDARSVNPRKRSLHQTQGDSVTSATAASILEPTTRSFKDGTGLRIEGG